MIRPYEAMFITRPQLEDEQVDGVVKKVEEAITRNGGEMVRTEKKGKKRLAYEVKDHKDGYYVLFNFNLDSTKLPEVERQLRLNEDVIRHLILRQEEVGPILPKPSAPPPAPAVSAAPHAPAAPPAQVAPPVQVAPDVPVEAAPAAPVEA